MNLYMTAAGNYYKADMPANENDMHKIGVTTELLDNIPAGEVISHDEMYKIGEQLTNGVIVPAPVQE